MRDVEEFKQTYVTFMKYFNDIKAARSYAEVDELEKRLVRTLQLMEAQMGYVGRGVYDEVTQKRRELMVGDTPAPLPEKKPKKKSKKK